MLCYKYQKREIDLSSRENEETLRDIEALNYEKEYRLHVLNYIRDNKLNVEPDMYDKYKLEYYDFTIELEKALETLIKKYKTPNKSHKSFYLNFETKTLSWLEEM